MTSVKSSKHILKNAFSLATTHPTVFLPRLALSLIWSLLWIWLFDTLHAGPSLLYQNIEQFSIALIMLTPVQIWVFNMYICLVDTTEHGSYNMRKAAKEGFKRLPHGIAAFLGITIVSLLPILAGTAITVIGITQQQTTIIILGITTGIILFTLLMAAAYLVPPAVVLGTGQFTTNLRTGITASYENRKIVIVLTLISIALLAATLLLEGLLKTIGAISFVIGRLAAAIIGTYIVLINPELYVNTVEDSN